MSGPTIDLNCDLGEGFGPWTIGDDAAMLNVVTSASVACGFHAGDPLIMRRICEAAAANAVAVGAHVSYPDLRGFGRRAMQCSPEEITADVLYQVGALQAVAQASGTSVTYVKPHGALYHAAATDSSVATAVARGCTEADASLTVVGLPDSAMEHAATTAGLAFAAEGFADRAYTPAGQLLPRTQPGAVLHDPALIAAQVTRMALRGEVEAVDGSVVPVRVDTLCVHGDTPGAVAIATAVRSALLDSGVRLAPFTRHG